MSEFTASTIHNEVGSDTLLVAFSALQSGVKPHFEFKSLLASDRGFDTLLVRDTHNLWFQKGTAAVGNSIDEMATHLQQFRKKYCKVYLIGASMGGYAALILGQLIKADASVILGGQSFIDNETRKMYNDMRWQDTMWTINKECDSKYFELRSVFRELQVPIIPNYWFYGEFHKLDRFHALRMAEFTGTHIYEIQGADHYGGLAMNVQGILHNTIDDIIAGRQPRALGTRYLLTIKD